MDLTHGKMQRKARILHALKIWNQQVRNVEKFPNYTSKKSEFRAQRKIRISHVNKIPGVNAPKKQTKTPLHPCSIKKFSQHRNLSTVTSKPKNTKKRKNRRLSTVTLKPKNTKKRKNQNL
jgi:hypothetical protein